MTMREKYIEERFGGQWRIFGEHPNGLVDVANTNGDVICGVTREDAERAIELFNRVLGFAAQTAADSLRKTMSVHRR